MSVKIQVSYYYKLGNSFKRVYTTKRVVTRLGKERTKDWRYLQKLMSSGIASRIGYDCKPYGVA